MAFLALFAGMGFEIVAGAVKVLYERYGRPRMRISRAALTAVCAVTILVPCAYDTFHGHTNGSTYYNALFGGYGAMGRHRMQREFWGNSAFSALPWLNEHAKKYAHVDFHDTAWDSVKMYWRDGILRRDIKPLWNSKKADYFLFHWHKEFLDLEERARKDIGNVVPVHVIEQDGVPILNVYERPPKEKPPRTLPVVRPQAPIRKRGGDR